MARFTRPHTPSLLRDKTFAAMKNFAFEKIIQEVDEKCPDLLDVVVSVCAPGKSLAKGVQQRIPAIGTIVGILMHQHNRELNLVQRVNTILLATGHAEKKVGPLFIRRTESNSQRYTEGNAKKLNLILFSLFVPIHACPSTDWIGNVLPPAC